MFNFRSSERHSTAAVATLVLLSSAGLAAMAREPGINRPLVILGSVRMPELCLIHRATGRRCPGCGMSRAFVLLWRGQIREAVKLNPASPFVFATFIWLALGPVVSLARRLPGRAVGYGHSSSDVPSPARSSLPTKPRR